VSKSEGKIWPYAIGASILLVFGACVATLVITHTIPVEESDTYMMGYHEADAKANEIIKDRIAFDKLYKIEYITNSLSKEKTIIKYKLTDISGHAVNDAKIKVIITRPNIHKYDLELINPSVDNGIYTFESVSLEVDGRWDVMAKVNIEESQRFFNVKADTRQKEAYEY